MKLYYTEKKSDFEALMVELESQGVIWFSGNKMTEFNDNWEVFLDNTCVRVSGGVAWYRDVSHYMNTYPHVPIEKYSQRVS